MKNILKEAGLDPGPKRGAGMWEAAGRRHAATLWASDFLKVRTATLGGFVGLDLLFFIHAGTRRAFVAGISANPTSSWVTQQARNASMQMAEWGLQATHVLINHDTKHTDDFGAVLAVDGCEVTRVGPRAPNRDAYAERFAQSLRQECLDHFIVPGEDTLRHVTRAFLEHYNRDWSHHGVGNDPLPQAATSEPKEPGPSAPPLPTGKVRCKERLGGSLSTLTPTTPGASRAVTSRCNRPPGAARLHARIAVPSLECQATAARARTRDRFSTRPAHSDRPQLSTFARMATPTALRNLLWSRCAK
ncbi:integrase core domain-containing protein [Gemmata sp.]|uniref:integrase core domain-containing protein n=1 Tax=Gemmata sp. TaxID=1914242 RepID=UPI003F70282C